MFDIVNVVQGTPEWLEWRRSMICASDMPVILGFTKFSNIRLLYLDKKNKMRGMDSSAMRRGREREPDAREMFEAIVGAPCTSPVIASKQTPWGGASIDAINIELGIGAEIKCPTDAEIHKLAVSGVVPFHYMPQVQWQMYCTGYSSWEYVSYCPECLENPYVQFVVKRDERMIDEMLEKGKWFKNCVDNDINPVTEEWIDDQVRYGKIEELESLLSQRDYCEDKIKEIKEELTSTFECPRARGGNLLFTYEVVPGRVDYNNLLSAILPPDRIEDTKKEYKKPDSGTWKVRRV